MRAKKRASVLVLVLVMILGLSLPAQAATESEIIWLGGVDVSAMGEGMIIARTVDYDEEKGWQYGEYYGAYDYHGNLVIPFEYDYLGLPSNGLMDAQKDGLCGYLDTRGNVVIPFQYNTAGPFSFSDDGYAIVTGDDRYWRLIDKTGKEVIDYLSNLNLSGNMYVKEYVEPSSWDQGKKVYNTYIYQIYDFHTHELLSKYTISGSGRMQSFTKEGYSAFMKDGKCGIVDMNGNVVVPYMYASHSANGGVIHTRCSVSVSEGKYVVGGIDTDGDRHSDTITVTDLGGNEIVPAGKYTYSSMMIYSEMYFSNGLLIVEDVHTGKTGVINTSGSEVIPCQYDSIHRNTDQPEHYFVASIGTDDLVISETGEVLLDSRMSGLRFFGLKDGLVEVMKETAEGDQYGLMNLQGEFVVPLQQSFKIDYWSGDGVATIHIGGSPTDPQVRCGILKFTPQSVPSASVDQPSGWAQGYVEEAVEAGIVPASLQSKYTQATTRGEFCALAVQLYETVSGKEVTERVQFSDTKDINVEKAAALGVISGVGENRAAPDQSLTREQAAVMLTKLAEVCGKPLQSGADAFADAASISGWAVNAVDQVGASGIMSGTGNGNFSPQAQYTREQSITTMLSLYKFVK